MNSKSRKSKATALKAAARAVMSHNDELAAHLERGVAIFTESPPISERLKCETNGAHKYIEDFATALKAFQRGCGAVQLVMAEVKVSCIDLVLAIKETERLLPASVTEADRRAFLDGCEMVINEETIFANLVSGVSGTSPDCPHELYCRRIDNSVNSIKKHLTELNIAIQHIERDLRRKSAGGKTSGGARRMRGRSSPATKADLNAAVRRIASGTIYRKPGPKPTDGKRRQIAAAKDYEKTHCGCSYRNACIRTFEKLPGGYSNAKSLYESTREKK